MQKEPNRTDQKSLTYDNNRAEHLNLDTRETGERMRKNGKKRSETELHQIRFRKRTKIPDLIRWCSKTYTKYH